MIQAGEASAAGKGTRSMQSITRSLWLGPATGLACCFWRPASRLTPWGSPVWDGRSLDHAARRPAHADECGARGYRHDGGRNGTAAYSLPASCRSGLLSVARTVSTRHRDFLATTPTAGRYRGAQFIVRCPPLTGPAFDSAASGQTLRPPARFPARSTTAPPYSLGTRPIRTDKRRAT